MALAAYAPRVAFFDANGDPLSGGKVYFYQPGTTTPKDTYTTAAASTPNANPVILNSRGEAAIYLDGTYKVRLETSASVLIYEEDNFTQASLSGFGVSAFMQTVLDDTTAAAALTTLGVSTAAQAVLDDTSNNAILTTLTATRAESGAAAVPILNKFREIVTPEDFGAVGDGSTNDQTALANTLAAGAGKTIVFRKRYAHLAGLTVSASNTRLIFADGAALVLTSSSSSINQLLISGAGAVSSTTITLDVTTSTRTVSVSDNSIAAVGDWVVVNRTNASGFQHYLVTRVVAKPTGQFTFSDAIPVGMLASDNPVVQKVSMLSGIYVQGLRLEGALNTGTTTHGLVANYLVDSEFNDITGIDFNDGGAINISLLHNVTMRRLRAERSGTGGFSDIGIGANTNCFVEDVVSRNATGFGPQFFYSVYGSVVGVRSQGAVGRGIKTSGCVWTNFKNLTAVNSSFTGLSISNSTIRCTFDGITTLNNLSGEGVWLSDQQNIGNIFSGIQSFGNAAWDIACSSSDTSNVFEGDWVTQAIVPASTVIRRSTSGVRYNTVGRPASFRAVKNGTDQTGVTPSTWVKVTWPTETLDNAAWFDTTNSRIQPTQACAMLLRTNVLIDVNVVDGAQFYIGISKNGTIQQFAGPYHAGSTAAIGGYASATVDFNGSSDYAEINVWMSGSGDKTIDGGNTATWFEGEII